MMSPPSAHRPVAGGVILVILLAFTLLAEAQPYVFTTIAGSPGQTGTNDGTSSTARFHYPEFLTTDAAGTLYVSDTGNHAIRQLTYGGTGWTVHTITNDPSLQPKGIVADQNGNIFFGDYVSGTIQKLTRNGTNWDRTMLGSAVSPSSLARDLAGNFYYPDYLDKVIMRLSPDGTNWINTRLAGTPGTFGATDGTNGDASFASPTGIAVDSATNLYLGDSWAYTVRQIAPVETNWVVTTIAGATRGFGGADGTNSDALFGGPAGIAISTSGFLVVADPFNQAIRKVTPDGTNWVVVTIGGLLGFSNSGSADGVGTDARFNMPNGVAVDKHGNIYVADTQNSTIRLGTPLTLAIQSTGLSNQVAISWPLLATGFVLETSTSLPPALWTTLSNGIVPSVDKYVLVTNATASQAFFRLRKPQ